MGVSFPKGNLPSGSLEKLASASAFTRRKNRLGLTASSMLNPEGYGASQGDISSPRTALCFAMGRAVTL